MSRDISSTNLAEINAASYQLVTLVKLEFDTPVYVHSGIGTITFDTNDYTGVGDYGSIAAINESELLGPSSIEISLSGIPSALINEALDAGNFRDRITIYEGYRLDDGTLVDDPWEIWSGLYQYATIAVGEEAAITITAQHDLAILQEKSNSRFTDEDQQQRYTGDRFFKFVTEQQGLRLKWGNTRIADDRIGDPPVPPGGEIP